RAVAWGSGPEVVEQPAQDRGRAGQETSQVCSCPPSRVEIRRRPYTCESVGRRDGVNTGEGVAERFPPATRFGRGRPPSLRRLRGQTQPGLEGERSRGRDRLEAAGQGRALHGPPIVGVAGVRLQVQPAPAEHSTLLRLV